VRDYGPIPPGKKRAILEVNQGESLYARLIDVPGYHVLSCETGPEAETADEKKARLLREAAVLIRRGTQLSSPIGSEELRRGFLRIAEALEVEE
jgi:hypothetical protein